jgi:hypothetical protein
MKKTRIVLAAGLLLASAVASAQTPMRIRGTITGLDGDVLSVKTRQGQDVKINLAPNYGVAAAKAVTLADFGPGAYVGSTAKKNAAGQLVASEVHRLPPQAPAGHTPWDSAPGDTMTNANVAKVVKAAGGNELTLEYKGGSQTILVPEGTPIIDFVPGDKSLLVPGATVFVGASQGADGKLSAGRVAVSKGGAKPPQ